MTPEEKANAEKIANELFDYLFSRVMEKVNNGMPYEHAVLELMREITEESQE